MEEVKEEAEMESPKTKEDPGTQPDIDAPRVPERRPPSLHGTQMETVSLTQQNI